MRFRVYRPWQPCLLTLLPATKVETKKQRKKEARKRGSIVYRFE